jgi:hypothetical protein
MNIAIMVGIDGAGKTPLLGLIKKEDPTIDIVRLIPDPTKLEPGEAVILALEEVRKWEQSKLSPRTVLYDRFPRPDDWVYRGIWGPNVDYSKLHLELDFRMSTLGVKLIYVEPKNMAAYYLRMLRNPDEYLGLYSLPKILYRYRQFLKESTIYPRLKVKSDWFTERDARMVINFIKGGE